MHLWCATDVIFYMTPVGMKCNFLEKLGAEVIIVYPLEHCLLKSGRDFAISGRIQVHFFISSVPVYHLHSPE